MSDQHGHDPNYCDDYDDDCSEGPWCRDYDNHKPGHHFCDDHQSSWCRLCNPSGCPYCIEDPHCPECHAAIFSEEHDWDCSYYGEDEDE